MNTRVPVVNPDGSPAMPTLCSRARRWVRDGKAVGKWNDLGVYYVQLLVTPSDTKTQTIVCGCDPGKSYSGFGVQSSFTTLFRTHAILPFQRLTSSVKVEVAVSSLPLLSETERDSFPSLSYSNVLLFVINRLPNS